MEYLIRSGHVVDLALVVLAAEIVGFALIRRALGRAPGVLSLVGSALPGACLLLALRASLTGASWIWIALFLAFSLPAHVADLRLRPPK